VYAVELKDRQRQEMQFLIS